ncbi:MAG: preprotein translocase subunit SecY [Clostridia bacterium]|nr:preprotein translocase subunit SecY [Clostridia bacterium]
MFETIKNAWSIKELRHKILFTLLILLITRIGMGTITVPYVNPEAVGLIFNSTGNQFFGYLNLLSGGAFQSMTLFAMSITPYINASIIVQLLTIAIPALEKMVKEGGEEGRKKQAALTRYVTVIIGLIQGFAYFMAIRNMEVTLNDGSVIKVLEDPNVWKAFAIIGSFVAGSAIIMWLGEQITTYGIGNGISMILFTGIISRIPSVAISLYANVAAGTLNIFVLAAMLIAFLAVIVFIVFVSDAERRIPTQYAKRVVGRKIYGGQSSHIPLKVNMTGVMPVIFASSIVSLPSIIYSFMGKTPSGFGNKFTGFGDALVSWLSSPSPVYVVLYFVMIIGFSFFYAYTQFNPIEVANNLKNQGGSIPGYRPGKPTADFINRVLKKVTVIGAIFLGIIAVLPIIVSVFSPSLSGIALGGTTVLIVVGVALDTVKSLEAQLIMRHHKGFLE